MKRYRIPFKELANAPLEVPDGEWVKAADADAENARLRKALEEYRGAVSYALWVLTWKSVDAKQIAVTILRAAMKEWEEELIAKGLTTESAIAAAREALNPQNAL